jgi:hypothetical protein
LERKPWTQLATETIDKVGNINVETFGNRDYRQVWQQRSQTPMAIETVDTWTEVATRTVEYRRHNFQKQQSPLTSLLSEPFSMPNPRSLCGPIVIRVV